MNDKRLGRLIMATIEYIPSNIGLPSPLKVAAYCRVSTNRPDQLYSLASQERYYEDMIKNHSYWSFVGVYSDIGSGTRLKNRSGFRSMLSACRRGKIDMILVKSAQRFARNTTDGLKVIRMLRNKNINIYFEQENIHSLFENSEFLLTVMCARAQAESHSKSEDIKWGIRKAFTNPDSKYYQRKCYGYKHDEKGNLIINEHEANIVRLIYQMSGEGASLAQISSELFRQGIPSPRGCAVWSRETLRQIMCNEKYTGNVTLQKTFVENFLTHKQVKNTGQLEQYQVSGNHEPIIGIVK